MIKKLSENSARLHWTRSRQGVLNVVFSCYLCVIQTHFKMSKVAPLWSCGSIYPFLPWFRHACCVVIWQLQVVIEACHVFTLPLPSASQPVQLVWINGRVPYICSEHGRIFIKWQLQYLLHFLESLVHTSQLLEQSSSMQFQRLKTRLPRDRFYRAQCQDELKTLTERKPLITFQAQLCWLTYGRLLNVYDSNTGFQYMSQLSLFCDEWSNDIMEEEGYLQILQEHLKSSSTRRTHRVSHFLDISELRQMTILKYACRLLTSSYVSLCDYGDHSLQTILDV